MKKFVLFLIMAFSCLYLFSCNEKNGVNNQKKEIIDVGNVESNTQIYNDFSCKLNTFKEQFLNSNDITIDLEQIINSNKERTVLKYYKDSSIMDIEQNNERLIFDVNEDDIFLYNIDDINKSYTKTQYKKDYDKVNEFLDNLKHQVLSSDEDDVFDFIINPEKSSVKFEKNRFYFSSYATDFLTEADKKSLDFLLKSMSSTGHHVSVDLDDVIVYSEALIIDKEIHLSYKFTLNVMINTDRVTYKELSTQMKYILKHSQNDLIDFSQYKYEKPTKLDDVWEYDNIEGVFTIDSKNSYAGMFRAEKGVYVVDFKNKEILDDCQLTLYDSSQRQITNLDIVKNYTYDVSYYFILDCDGLYYYTINNISDSSNEFTFKNVNLDTKAIKNINAFKTSDLIFDNEYDVKIFKEEVKNPKSYLITNNSNYDLNFIVDNNLVVYCIEANSEEYVSVIPGRITYAVTLSDKSENVDDAIVNIEVEEIKEYGSTNQSDINDNLEGEYNRITVNPYENKYLNLNLDSNKILQFDSKESMVNISLIDANGNVKIVKDVCIIPAGKYTLKISGKDNSASYSDLIRYVEIDKNEYDIITEEFEAEITSEVTYNEHFFVTLKINKAGGYKILFEEYNNGATIINANTLEVVSTVYNYFVYLEVGKYLILNENKIPYLTKAKYVFKEYNEIENIDVDLLEHNDLSNNPNNYLYSSRLKPEQTLNYWFSLEETTNILFNPNRIIIFDDNGKQLTIHEKNKTWITNKSIISLDAGNYYFKHEPESNYEIQMEIFKTASASKYINQNNLMTLSADDDVELQQDSMSYYNDYFLINIEADGTYKLKLENIYARVYDSNFNYLENEFDNSYSYEIEKEYVLSKGIYYVSFDNTSNASNLKASLNKVS